jgi:hypothetical protein
MTLEPTGFDIRMKEFAVMRDIIDASGGVDVDVIGKQYKASELSKTNSSRANGIAAKEDDITDSFKVIVESRFLCFDFILQYLVSYRSGVVVVVAVAVDDNNDGDDGGDDDENDDIGLCIKGC